MPPSGRGWGSLAVHRHLHAAGGAAGGKLDVGAAACHGRKARLGCWVWRAGECQRCPARCPPACRSPPPPPAIHPPTARTPSSHRLSPMTIWLMPDSMTFWCSAGTPVAEASLARISSLPAPASRSMVTSSPHARCLVSSLTCVHACHAWQWGVWVGLWTARARAHEGAGRATGAHAVERGWQELGTNRGPRLGRHLCSTHTHTQPPRRPAHLDWLAAAQARRLLHRCPASEPALGQRACILQHPASRQQHLGGRGHALERLRTRGGGASREPSGRRRAPPSCAPPPSLNRTCIRFLSSATVSAARTSTARVSPPIARTSSCIAARWAGPPAPLVRGGVRCGSWHSVWEPGRAGR